MSGFASASHRVAAVGMFDGVHPGHSFVLKALTEIAAAKKLESLAITFSRHPLAALAPDRCPGSLCSIEERCRRLRASGINLIAVLDFDDIRHLTAREFIEKIHSEFGVDILVMGYDNHIGSDRCSAAVLMPRCGEVDIIELPPCPGDLQPSSSAVRSAVTEGRVDDACRLLGRPYAIAGTVVEGRRLGRTIGFPTANIQLPDDCDAIVPAPGVYAVNAIPEGREPLPAMMNIGTRPTVNGHHRTLEVHIPGFDGNLYGQRLTVEFLRRLRDEKKFDSIDDLRRQLIEDRRQISDELN